MAKDVILRSEGPKDLEILRGVYTEPSAQDDGRSARDDDITMRNIKLILEYDGSAFYGFQRQPHHPTVQAALEKALSQLLNRKTKIAAASGRTDTGVHATHQVVNFRTDSRLPARQIQRALNALLPKQIAVKDAREVAHEFHARFHAKRKIYEYFVWNHPIRSPLLLRRAYHVPHKLNLSKMRLAARLLTGAQDFGSFCASHGKGRKKENTQRRVAKIRIMPSGDLLRFSIEADGFLYHMVRNFIGALLDVGEGKLSLKELRKIILSKDRKLAPDTAPAHGLVLSKVLY